MPKVNWRGTIEERFWRKVDKKGENECWIWKIYTVRGYGQMNIRKKIISTHRFSYELHKGEIPKGMFVCHSCDNPPCVNPKHLWLGTAKENMQDKKQKGHGNEGEKCKTAKLTWKKVAKIRKMYTTGKYTQTKLAELFGLKQPSSIGFIVRNINWKI